MPDNTQEKVYKITFDNKKFEKNIKSTIKNVEKLDEDLKFKGSKNELRDVTEKLEKLNDIDFENTNKQINTFVLSLKDIIKYKIVGRVIDTIADATVHFIKSMSGISNVINGWQKYEQQIVTVGGILNNVKSQGKTLDDVANSMKTLQWYTDETSFSFTTLSNGIKQFTTAGVELDKATQAAMGVTSLAGASKVFDQYKIQSAMDAVSKSLQTGYVDVMKWTSLTNTAGIVSQEFSQLLMDEAVAQGKLKKSAAGQYKTTNKGILVTTENIRDTLSSKWLTSDVLSNVLAKYNSAAEEVKETMDRIAEGGATEAEVLEMQKLKFDENTITVSRTIEMMQNLGHQFDEISLKALKSSQETSSFSQAVQSIKDAVSTTYMQSFELIFGDAEQSVKLWSEVNEQMYDIFLPGLQKIVDILSEWNPLEEGGMADLHEAIINLFEAISTFKSMASEAFSDVFGDIDAVDVLSKIVSKFKEWTESLKNNEKAQKAFKDVFTIVFSLIKIAFKFLKPLVSIAKSLIKLFTPVVDLIGKVLDSLARSLLNFANSVGEMDGIDDIINGIADGLNVLITVISNLINFALPKIGKLISFFSQHIVLLTALLVVAKLIKSVVGIFVKLKGIKNIFDALADFGWSIAGLVSGAKFNVYASAILKFAVAISMIGLAVNKLSELSVGQAVQGVIMMTLIISALIGTMVILKKLQKSKMLPSKKTLLSFRSAIISMSLLMLSLSVLINASKDVKPSKLYIITSILYLLFGLLFAFALATNKFKSPTKNRINNVLSLSIALSMFILSITAVITAAKDVEPKQLWAITAVLSVITTLFSAFIITMNLITTKASKKNKMTGMIGMVVALSLFLASFSGVISSARGVDAKQLWTITAVISVIVALFGVFIVAMNIMSPKAKKSDRMKGITKIVISLGILLLAFSSVIRSAKDVEAKQLWTIVGVVFAMVSIFSAFLILMNKMRKTVADKDRMAGITSIVLSLSILLLTFSIIIRAAKDVEYGKLWTIVGIVSAISVVFMSFIILMNKMQKSVGKDTKMGGVIKIVAALSLLIVSFSILIAVAKDVPPKQLWTIVAVITVIISVFAMFVLMMNKIQKSVGKDTKMVGVIAIVVAMVLLITSLTLAIAIVQNVNPEVIGAVVLAIVSVLGAIIALILFINNTNIDFGKTMAVTAGFLAISVGFILIAKALSIIANSQIDEGTIGVLSLLLAAVTLCVVILDKIGGSSAKLLAASLAIAILSASLIAISAALVVLSKEDFNSVLKAAIILGSIIALLTVAMAALGAMGPMALLGGVVLAVINVTVSALAVSIAYLAEKLADASIKLAEAFKVFEEAFVGGLKELQQINDKDGFGFMANLALALGVLAASLIVNAPLIALGGAAVGLSLKKLDKHLSKISEAKYIDNISILADSISRLADSMKTLKDIGSIRNLLNEMKELSDISRRNPFGYSIVTPDNVIYGFGHGISNVVDQVNMVSSQIRSLRKETESRGGNIDNSVKQNNNYEVAVNVPNVLGFGYNAAREIVSQLSSLPKKIGNVNR